MLRWHAVCELPQQMVCVRVWGGVRAGGGVCVYLKHKSPGSGG